jgi:hypothetical protein
MGRRPQQRSASPNHYSTICPSYSPAQRDLPSSDLAMLMERMEASQQRLHKEAGDRCEQFISEVAMPLSNNLVESTKNMAATINVVSRMGFNAAQDAVTSNQTPAIISSQEEASQSLLLRMSSPNPRGPISSSSSPAPSSLPLLDRISLDTPSEELSHRCRSKKTPKRRHGPR